MFKKMGPVWPAGFLALSLSMGAAAAQPASPAGLVLEGGTLIDGTGKPPLADSVIVVQGTRITAVGRKGQVRIPAGAQVINVSGRTILPGFIDTHVHLQEWMPPIFLPYGVTTIVDANSDPAWIFAQRDLLSSGKIVGPRMFVSGAGMDGTVGGRVVGQFNTPIAATVEDARTILRNNIAAGADNVKVLQDITNDQLSAAIQVAKETGKPALGHTANIHKASELGFKVGEHTWTIALGALDPEDKHPVYNAGPGPGEPSLESRMDPKTFPDLINVLVKNGTYLDPHLTNSWRGATPRGAQFKEDAAKILSDPGLAWLPEGLRTTWLNTPPTLAGWENVKEFLGQFAAAGGKVVAGTDTGFGGRAIPGLYVHYEMQMFVDVGFTPMQAIQSATLWNAELLQKTADLGSIAPGKLADFVIIEGNPLADISATRNVRMVIKDGKVMDTKYDPKWANPLPQPYSVYQDGMPRPAITALAPAMVQQGGQAVTLAIEGSRFTPGSVVRFDNADLPTSFVSAGKLTATLAPGQMPKAPGAYPVYVVNTGIHGTITEEVFLVVAPQGASPDDIAKLQYTKPVERGRFASTSLHQISGLAPRSAPQGGQSVTLKLEGLEFAPNSVVHFDNAELPTTFVNSKTLTATLDARLLQRAPASYVLYVVSPGSHGYISQPAYFMVGLRP